MLQVILEVNIQNGRLTALYRSNMKIVTLAASLFAACIEAAPAAHGTLQARQNTCTIRSEHSRSTGGGGPGQAPVDVTGSSLNCYGPDGKSRWYTHQDTGAFKRIDVMVPGSSCGSSDIYISESWNSASVGYVYCQWSTDGYPSNTGGNAGSLHSDVDSGTVSVQTAVCEFTVPCN
ncbi:hypothetical protein Slin15195_G115930 [Septoria linicola]|uniref:Uncharacterized protein n=1 Tax=Septoria linicola TaxID=215465 RepID=A0A9Q9EQ11_9PEZI|nr:hypothetical protein Slin15195_G115930 [Septoria linicola]